MSYYVFDFWLSFGGEVVVGVRGKCLLPHLLLFFLKNLRKKGRPRKRKETQSTKLGKKKKGVEMRKSALKRRQLEKFLLREMRKRKRKTARERLKVRQRMKKQFLRENEVALI